MSCLVPGEALSLERSVKTNCLIRFQVQQHCHFGFYQQMIEICTSHAIGLHNYKTPACMQCGSMFVALVRIDTRQNTPWQTTVFLLGLISTN